MLIVRLAAAQAPLHWQLFAPGEPHHEASGRWPTDDASPFPALAEQYPAPGADPGQRLRVSLAHPTGGPA